MSRSVATPLKLCNEVLEQTIGFSESGCQRMAGGSNDIFVNWNEKKNERYLQNENIDAQLATAEVTAD